MANREAVARIKINKFLEAAGWRFLAEGTRDYEHHDSMSPVRQLTVKATEFAPGSSDHGRHHRYLAHVGK